MRRALLLLALIGCGDDSAATDAGTDTSADGGVDSGIEYQMHDEIRVEADDGSATLIIAPNSLPVGVDESEIQVVAGAMATLQSDDDTELLASYELLPDGLVFREAARLEVAVDTEVSPIGLLVSDVGAQTVGVTVDDDMPVTGRFARVTATVPHFSSLLLVRVTGRPSVVSSGLRDTVLFGLTETLVEFRAPDGGVKTFGILRNGVDTDVTYVLRGATVQAEQSNLVRIDTASGDPHESEPIEPGGRASWEPTFLCNDIGEMSVTLRAYFSLDFFVRVDGEEESSEEVRDASTHTSMGACGLLGMETSGDCVDSEGPAVECSFFDALIDMEGSDLNRYDELTPEEASALFGNTAYPCDELGGGLRTVCRATPGEFAEGAMWVGTMVLGTDVPDNDPDHSLIYSLVFDSDNVPDNDWVPIDPFIWDYFQGTDRWYQLIWNHLTRTWSVTVTQVDETQTTTDVPSAVRVVIVQNAVTFFIPVTELPSATPAYRFSAFAHDGSFSRTDRGGDVSGVDPTVPPQMFMP